LETRIIFGHPAFFFVPERQKRIERKNYLAQKSDGLFALWSHVGDKPSKPFVSLLNVIQLSLNRGCFVEQSQFRTYKRFFSFNVSLMHHRLAEIYTDMHEHPVD
jgi:hypothetical protein